MDPFWQELGLLMAADFGVAMVAVLLRDVSIIRMCG